MISLLVAAAGFSPKFVFLYDFVFGCRYRLVSKFVSLHDFVCFRSRFPLRDFAFGCRYRLVSQRRFPLYVRSGLPLPPCPQANLPCCFRSSLPPPSYLPSLSSLIISLLATATASFQAIELLSNFQLKSSDVEIKISHLESRFLFRIRNS